MNLELKIGPLKVIGKGRIIGLAFIGLEEFSTRVRQIATQHIQE